MTALTVRNVPDGVYRRLRADAVRHRRSLNQETIRQLEHVPAGSTRPEAGTLAQVIDEIDAFRRELARRGFHTTEEEIDAFINDGRE